jgi:YfiH family protein
MELTQTPAGLRYYHANLDVKHGFFTRHGGVSREPFASLNLGGSVGDASEAVRENHLRMYRALGLNAQRAVTTWLVHSCDVVVATEPMLEGQTWLAQADAIITQQPDMPLTMRYADCTPIVLHDPIQQAIGIVHAGWRGTAQRIASVTVQAMVRAFGTRPSDVRAVVGPSISWQNYPVGENVVSAIQEAYQNTEGLLRPHPDDGQACLDLWATNARDLHEAGVEDVQILPLCTAERTDEFYSHRAEGGKTGRFGAVISL